MGQSRQVKTRQVKKNESNESVKDITKNSEIKEKLVDTTNCRPRRTRSSVVMPPEVDSNTKMKKEKCEENSKKKNEIKNEVSKSNNTSRSVDNKSSSDKSSSHRSSSSSRSVSRSRETSKATRDTSSQRQRDSSKVGSDSKSQSESKKMNEKPIKKNETEEEEEMLDFSAIENKIFEGFTSAETKKTEKKNTMIKKSDHRSSRTETQDRKGDAKDKKQERNKSVERKHSSSRSRESKSNRKEQENKEKHRESHSPSKHRNEHSSKPKTSDKNRKSSKTKSPEKRKASKADSDSDMSDWEEVEGKNEVTEMEELLSGSQPSVSGEGTVQIELDAPNLLWGIKKRKKRSQEELIEDYLRKHVNRSIKEGYENMHKAHLLCLFAHGRYVNQILNKDTLLGAALSIITDKNAYPPKRLDMNYLEKFVKWFGRKITMKPGDLEKNYWKIPLEMTLVKRFESRVCLTYREFVYMFIVVCRALGINIRLVLSLQPMSWKPSAEALIKRKKAEEPSNTFKEPETVFKEPTTSKTPVLNKKESDTKIKKEKKDNRKMLSSDTDEEPIDKKKSKKPLKTMEARGREQSKSRKRKSNTTDDEGDSDFDPNEKKIRKGPKASTSQRRKSGEKRPSDDDSDEKGKKRRKTGKEEKEEKKKKEAFIEWAEIYVEEEEKWVCVDITRGKIHCVAEIQTRMPSSSAYITAYNPNLTVKDVTRRYVSNWLSSERKIRLSSKWWEKSLMPFRCAKTRLDKEEDKEMEQNLHHQPLPKSIAEYKNHPLYALQRHLLKFEAIYPPDVGPVGFIKGEPVYPRDSVYTLCSRDTWMKEAKTVKVDEEPYKVVKARPKWDRNTCQVVKDRPLEVFGEWQVEDFVPPVAKNGKVPRNEYGNVELFKPSMLPGGTVHIQINGLNRLARKLNIDCAAAMVGFDFHGGWTHPVYDGYVVCEEFKDVLLDAWKEDQAEQERKAEEKRLKRIYDNWKKLINGMIIKERVREKYGSSIPEEEESEEVKKEVEDIKKEKEEEVEEKEEEKEVSKAGPEKRKITQEDIDAARPPLITHHVKNMKIDWSSNVVEMAKKSKKRTPRAKSTVKKKVPAAEKKAKAPLKQGEASKEDQVGDRSVNLDADSDSETDEEEKKAKIRAILDWGSKVVEANPDLSDDSDAEGEIKCTSSGFQPSLDSHPFYSSINKTVKNLSKKKQVRTKKKAKSKSGSNSESPVEEEEEIASASSSRSTTPDPDVDDFQDLPPACKRTSRRSVAQAKKTYKESEESEGDISLDESDCGDHLYEPKDTK